MPAKQKTAKKKTTKQTASKPAFIAAMQQRASAYIADGRARAARYMARRPHRSFRVTPTPKYKKGNKVGGVWGLVKGTFKTIWQEKRYILTLMFFFALATYIFVGGISQLNFLDLRNATQELFQGNIGAVGQVATLFTAAVTGSLNPSTGQLQQFLGGIIAFLFWLTMVWVLRRRLADQPTTVRDALYNAGAPIVPTILVAAAVMFQLIPGAIGVIGAVLTLNGIWFANGGVESMLVCAAAALLVLLSIYWAAGSALALIVITIPGMYPWRALAAASDLVIGQRWAIALRVMVMALAVVLIWAIILVPALLLDSWLKFNWLPLVPIVVQLLQAFTLTYCATYVYKMYRSML